MHPDTNYSRNLRLQRAWFDVPGTPGGWGLHFIKDSLLNVDASFQASSVHPTKPVWLLLYWLGRVLLMKLPSLKFELRVSQPRGQNPTWVCSRCFMDKDQVQITVLVSILGSWARRCWETQSLFEGFVKSAAADQSASSRFRDLSRSWESGGSASVCLWFLTFQKKRLLLCSYFNSVHRLLIVVLATTSRRHLSTHICKLNL